MATFTFIVIEPLLPLSSGMACLQISIYVQCKSLLVPANLSKSWSFPLFRVTVTCGLGGGSKGDQGKRTSRVKQAKDRRELKRERREISRYWKRRGVRRGRREVMRRRRRRENCTPLTHTFTRPHQDDWPELPVWEHWCQYWCCYRIKKSSGCCVLWTGIEGILGGGRQFWEGGKYWKRGREIRGKKGRKTGNWGVGWVAWSLLDRWFGKPDSALAMLM